MGPKSKDKRPSKRQKEEGTQTRRGRPCEDGGEIGGRHGDPSEELLGPAGAGWAEKDSPLGPLKGSQPCQHCDCRLLAPQLWGGEFLLFSVTQIVQFVRPATGNHPGSTRCLILAGEPTTPRDLKTHIRPTSALCPQRRKRRLTWLLYPFFRQTGKETASAFPGKTQITSVHCCKPSGSFPSHSEENTRSLLGV